MEQYKHNNEKWDKLFEEIGFKPEHFDMLNKYASAHTQYELINVLQSDKGFPESTLPYALRVLLLIQNEGFLNKIHFVSRPSEVLSVPTETTVTRYQFDIEYLRMIEDKEAFMSSQFTIGIAENLIKILKLHDVYVYILFSDMKTVDNVLHIFHRFGIQK